MKKHNALKPKWNIGEVYAYKIESSLGKEKGLLGRYFLLQKVDESPISPRVIAPIVYIKITEGESLPTSIEEYNRLEYVQNRTYEDLSRNHSLLFSGPVHPYELPIHLSDPLSENHR